MRRIFVWVAQDDGPSTVLRAWVDRVGAFIKDLDPNHLISSGIEGHGEAYVRRVLYKGVLIVSCTVMKMSLVILQRWCCIG